MQKDHRCLGIGEGILHKCLRFDADLHSFFPFLQIAFKKNKKKSFEYFWHTCQVNVTLHTMPSYNDKI